jgi:hypothetical protein
MDKTKISALVNLRLIDKTRLLKNLSGQLIVKLEIKLLEKERRNGDEVIIYQYTDPGENKIVIGHGRYKRPGCTELSPRGFYDPERDESGLGF